MHNDAAPIRHLKGTEAGFHTVRCPQTRQDRLAAIDAAAETVAALWPLGWGRMLGADASADEHIGRALAIIADYAARAIYQTRLAEHRATLTPEQRRWADDGAEAVASTFGT